MGKETLTKLSFVKLFPRCQSLIGFQLYVTIETTCVKCDFGHMYFEIYMALPLLLGKCHKLEVINVLQRLVNVKIAVALC